MGGEGVRGHWSRLGNLTKRRFYDDKPAFSLFYSLVSGWPVFFFLPEKKKVPEKRVFFYFFSGCFSGTFFQIFAGIFKLIFFLGYF